MHARDARQHEQEIQEPKFDLKVTYRDKLGKITHHDPYRMFAIDDQTYYERPKFSRNLFFGNGEAAGRLIEVDEEVLDKRTQKKRKFKAPGIDLGAEHVAYDAPLTNDQVLAKEVGDVRGENAALKAELEAIRLENESLKKASEPPASTKPAPSAKSAVGVMGSSGSTASIPNSLPKE